MQSSSPAASTSFSTILRSRSVSAEESNDMCTGLNFATRAARSGAMTNFASDGEDDAERMARDFVAGFDAELDCATGVGLAGESGGDTARARAFGAPMANKRRR